MSLPLPLFIGLRYLRARSSQFFVSFISWVSMLGICLGVAALIIILSVMNGFEKEQRARLLSLGSHATLSDNPRAMADWPRQVKTAEALPGVAGAAPYVELQGLLSREPALSPALLRGVDPVSEARVSAIGMSMRAGDADSLQPGARNLLMGRVLAYKLAVSVGDTVTVMIPVGNEDGDIDPRIQSFTVSGIFEVGEANTDGGLALIHLDDARALRGLDEGVTGLRLKFDDVFAAPRRVNEVAAALGGGFKVSDWARENASYFRAVRMEKTMMALIMLLIVTVAAFNIVATLVMVVTDKRTDIAILRTLGLKPRAVMGVFITQGVIIGWLGALLGVAAGLAVALNIDVIVPWLESTFGFQIMDASVFYITRIPSEVQGDDVISIAVAALLLTVVATIYPALRASRTQPADALRYE